MNIGVMNRRVKTGLEVFLEEELDALKKKKIGIVTNHTGVTANLDHIVDILYRRYRLDVRALFCPEHGIYGEKPPGIPIKDYIDPKTGLPVYSLYGEKRRKPPLKVLNKLDLLLYDIQDLGVRFYTYISTLFHVLEAVSEVDKEIFVLDRPNPLTGIYVEGPLLDLRFRSFIGIWKIPIRYGMTIGELALLFNDEADLNANLTVIKMRGWKRDMWYDETGLPWVPPSPNIPTLDSAILYPGTCLLEGTNISEGRGTTKPFELIGAPWIDEDKLTDTLRSHNLKGVIFRPAVFIPMYSKYSREVCRGVQIHIVNRDVIESVKIGLYIIRDVMELYPDKFKWRRIRGGKYHFDLLVGTDYVRRAIEEGRDVDGILDELKSDLLKFKTMSKKYFIYR